MFEIFDWIKPREINYQSLFQKACSEIFPNFWQIVLFQHSASLHTQAKFLDSQWWNEI